MKTLALAALLAAFVWPTGTPMPGVFEPFGMHTLPSAKTPVGPTVSGFALSLTAYAPTVTIGSPIWVIVELRPVSDQGARVFFGSRHSSYTFRITSKSDGVVVPSVPNDFGLDPFSGPPCGRPIPEGHSEFARFQLDEMYALTKPGTYSIAVSGTPGIACKSVTMRSNTVTITILPHP